MSVLQMTLVFRHSQSKGVPRLVLLALADEASDEGEVTAYRRSQSWLQKKANCGRTAVVGAIQTLVELGELEVVERGDGRASSDYQLHIEGSEIRTPAPRNPNPRGPKSEPPSSHSSPVSPGEGSSLRSEQTQRASLMPGDGARLAKDFWKWHQDETNGDPAQTFKALMGVSTACLDRGYPADEILAAMKLERRALTAARVIDRIGRTRREAEERPATSAIPAEVVRAMAAAASFLHSRFPKLTSQQRVAMTMAVAKLVKMGYGVGESMLRLAVGLRAPDWDNAFWLLNVQGVDRFTGPLENVADAMNRAYRNGGWKA